MVKTIFLDWNKTLSNSIFWEQMKNPAHPQNSFAEKLEEFLFKKNYFLINEWMLGREKSEGICQKISEAISLEFDILFEELVISSQKMKFVDERIPEILKVIRKKGIGVIVATDNMDTFRRFTVPGMELDKIFDGFLVSSELGCFKYDIVNSRLPFFDDYFRLRKLSYEEAVLIDDSIEKTGTFEKIGFEIKNVRNKQELVKALKAYVS